MAVTVTLTEADLVRLEVIRVDGDEDAALAFLRERILPQVRAQRGKGMISHLDGGRGSMR